MPALCSADFCSAERDMVAPAAGWLARAGSRQRPRRSQRQQRLQLVPSFPFCSCCSCGTPLCGCVRGVEGQTGIKLVDRSMMWRQATTRIIRLAPRTRPQSQRERMTACRAPSWQSLWTMDPADQGTCVNPGRRAQGGRHPCAQKGQGGHARSRRLSIAEAEIPDGSSRSALRPR